MSRFFHGTMTVVVLTVLAISFFGMQASGIHIQFHQILPKIGLYCAILAGAAFYRYRKVDYFVSALMIVFWMGLVSDLHVYPMFLAGRQDVPLQDELLAKADQALGLEVTEVLAWINQYPWAKQALDKIYYTLVFLMAVALLSTSLSGRFKAAQEYVISCVCAVAISFPLFAVFQALGPYVYYGYPADPMQADYLRVFADLKTQAIYTMDLNYTSGLMTFPSFHTILALLAGAALWSFPYVRWLGLGWAGLIVLSTLTTGTHYVIDLVAGGLVTVVSLMGAKAFSWAEARWLARAEQQVRLEPAKI